MLSTLALLLLSRTEHPDFILKMSSMRPVWMVHAKVQGADAVLALDTGSFSVRLDPDFVKRARLKVEGPVQLTLGREIHTVPVRVQKVNGDFEGLVANFQKRCDGIIGLDFLRDFRFEVDLGTKEVAFYRTPLAGKSGGVPLSSGGRRDWFRLPVLLDGKGHSMVLDCGTAICTVGPSAAAKLGLRPLGEMPVELIGTTDVMKLAVVDSFELGPIKVESPPLIIENADIPSVDGSLGTDVFDGGRVIFDLIASKLYVHPAEATDETPLEGRLRALGMRVILLTSEKFIMLVKPNTEAAKAGLSSGDEVVSIGGAPVQDVLADYRSEKLSPEQRVRLANLSGRISRGSLEVETLTRQGQKRAFTFPAR